MHYSTRRRPITALHGSAKHCCMGRSAKYRKHEISTPCRTKRVNRSKPNLAGVTTLGSTFDRQKIWGSIERWHPHAMAVCHTFVTLFSPLFPEPAYRSDATFAYHVLCIKRRGFVDTRAFWGTKLIKFTFWGSLAPKIANIFPQTGKSLLQ